MRRIIFTLMIQKCFAITRDAEGVKKTELLVKEHHTNKNKGLVQGCPSHRPNKLLIIMYPSSYWVTLTNFLLISDFYFCINVSVAHIIGHTVVTVGHAAGYFRR